MDKKKESIAEKRFGRLVAVKDTEQVKSGSRIWECICDCGNKTFVRRVSLVTGRTKSCGCLQKDSASIARTIDIPIGKQFDRLTVVSKHSDMSKWGDVRWICNCVCGNQVIVNGRDLKSRHTRSCGCYQKYKTGEAAFNKLYGNCKRNAERKELDFDLTKEKFRDLTKKNCFYCGVEPQTEWKIRHGDNGTYIYNGVNRVDNSRGYALNNVVPCCEMCNKAKNKHSREKFEKWLKRIALTWGDKGGIINNV